MKIEHALRLVLAMVPRDGDMVIGTPTQRRAVQEVEILRRKLGYGFIKLEKPK